MIINSDKLFAEHLKNFRKERKLTQEQLGEILNIDRTRISTYENAKRGITLYTLVDWAIKLNVPLSKLIPEIPKK